MTSGAYLDTEEEEVTAESVYDYYKKDVIPAVTASLPILLARLFADLKDYIKLAFSSFLHFLLPKHWADNAMDLQVELPGAPGAKLNQLWEQTMRAGGNNSVEEFLLRHFDSNKDGSISAAEMLNLTQALEKWHKSVTTPSSWYQWVSREWPMMDWKIGVFLWRTFGGIILTLCVLSIIPGRMHGISARILRWPVLGITYFLIGVELCVYIVIRLGIKLAELLFAKRKHRKLRRQMANAKSYEEWYEVARKLDKSQKRDLWQKKPANTSRRYNWSFIIELIKDLKSARHKNDPLLALAVLQQCTRKNVGGIMSEDLFSYTNTGEPMHIVRDFIEEVAKTMEWVTDEALKIPDELKDFQEESSDVKRDYEETLDRKARIEKDKIWKSLIRFATSMSFDERPHPRASSSAVTDVSVSSLESESEDQKQQEIIQRLLPGSPRPPGPHLTKVHREQMIDFFRRARTAYGRTALCLSGGSTMGSYHFGHIRGLLEAGVLPNIISGTSAGSVVAALICTRTDEEILRDMQPEVIVKKFTCLSRTWSERMQSLWKHGHMFSFDEWLELVKWFTMGNTTFEEAYKKTGRLFCVTVSATAKKAPAVLLNHLSAPNVTLASAILASAAVPGFVPPVKLQYKLADGTVAENPRDQTYFDGSIDNDIPTNGLAEMLNCQFFVAAQCNPHIVPFFFNPKGGVGRPSRWSSGSNEHSWRGGFLLATLEMYLKNDMKAKFRFLNELEAAVGFTSTLLTQDYHGTTTLVPQVHWIDYTIILSDPTLDDLYRHFRRGSIAAYEHIAMIKLHYRIADVLDNCLEALETGKRNTNSDRTKLRILLQRDASTPPDQICTENGTVSTNSSFHDDGDEESDNDSPSKWEEIPKKEKH